MSFWFPIFYPVPIHPACICASKHKIVCCFIDLQIPKWLFMVVPFASQNFGGFQDPRIPHNAPLKVLLYYIITLPSFLPNLIATIQWWRKLLWSLFLTSLSVRLHSFSQDYKKSILYNTKFNFLMFGHSTSVMQYYAIYQKILGSQWFYNIVVV